MAEPCISILVVNYNTSRLVEVILESIHRLTHHSYKVTVVDNNSPLAEYERLRSVADPCPHVQVERHETESAPAKALGEAMNLFVDTVDAPYFCLLESDIVWLKDAWDAHLLNRMDEETKVVGVENPGHIPRVMPSTMATLYETEAALELDLDFLPYEGEPPHDPNWLELGEEYGRSDPLSRGDDPGWEVLAKYPKAGYRGESIRGRNTRYQPSGPFSDLLVMEYYLDGDPDPIACHFGRGSKKGVTKYFTNPSLLDRILHRIPKVREALLERKGERRIQRWLDRCRQIIDEQENCRPPDANESHAPGQRRPN